jgi:hypothetical protein
VKAKTSLLKPGQVKSLKNKNSMTSLYEDLLKKAKEAEKGPEVTILNVSRCTFPVIVRELRAYGRFDDGDEKDAKVWREYKDIQTAVWLSDYQRTKDASAEGEGGAEDGQEASPKAAVDSITFAEIDSWPLYELRNKLEEYGVFEANDNAKESYKHFEDMLSRLIATLMDPGKKRSDGGEMVPEKEAASASPAGDEITLLTAPHTSLYELRKELEKRKRFSDFKDGTKKITFNNVLQRMVECLLEDKEERDQKVSEKLESSEDLKERLKREKEARKAEAVARSLKRQEERKMAKERAPKEKEDTEAQEEVDQ